MRNVSLNISVCLLMLLTFGGPLHADDQIHPLTIKAQGGDAWKASIADVEKVLHSAAGELWKHFPGQKLDPILVAPKGGPIVLFRRGPNREYYVRLNTGETYWAQYAYQFAHEMGHILAGYREREVVNQWFEESICEIASLYAIRQMSQSWKTNPPYPNWKGYAPSLADYAANLIKAAQLPKDQTLAQWYALNAHALRQSATQRERNQVAAVALLPLFEAEPEHWPAIGYLNVGEQKEGQTFEEHLKAWYEQVPEKHRAFVEKVAGQFGVKVGKQPR